MLNPFSWLRQQAAQAVTAGVADALVAVAADGEAPPADLDALRAQLAAAVAPKALPAAPAPDDGARKSRRSGSAAA